MSQLAAYIGPISRTDSQLVTQQSSRSSAYDPVDKLRVSQPQALIDTDFEYGVQPTKWESINLQNFRQGTYTIPQVYSAIQSASPTAGGIQTSAASSLVRVYMANTSAYTAYVTPIFITGATNPNVNGWWLVVNVSGSSFVEFYTTTAATLTQNVFNVGTTYVYPGFFYSQCGFQVGLNCISGGATNTPTITTITPHALNVGDLVYITGVGNSSNCNGAFIVATTLTSTTFTISLPNSLLANNPTNSAGVNNVFMRPAGWVETRPFDGGVAFSAGGTVTNQQLIRQTRRYFRYQSGKGIQFSTGSSLCPTLFQPVLTASGSPYLNLVTVTTPFAHNLAAGARIQITGATPAGYNGTYTITTRLSAVAFTYTVPSLSAPTSATATGANIRINPVNWYGAYNAVGFNDQQNGIFFKYDGVNLTAVLRSSTNQLNGKIQVTQGSGTLTGVGTQFTTQLAPGDAVVIRGQSYRITGITSDTAATFSPEYRGLTYDAANNPNGGYILSKTTDTIYPRSTWFDPMDGTGPSGYNIDLTRMQMWYIDYSWYGAGSIRWGFRGKDGAVTYCHQVQNNNVQFEAFMRSGNLPAHYESSGLTPTTYLTATLTSGDTTSMSINDGSLFNPTGGLAKVTVSGSGTAIEYISYTSVSGSVTAGGWTLNGLARGQVGGSAATTFTVTSPQAIYQTVEYATADSVPSISHWGSSTIMDGQYNDDKSLLLNYGMTTPLVTGGTTPIALVALRIAPSADTGTTGILGEKETINRMQLVPDSLSVVATGVTYLINLVLNGRLSTAFSGTGSQATFITPQQILAGFSSSLAQVAVNGATGTASTIVGGESVAAAYVQAGGVTTLDLSQVRDIGNSILGGGQNNIVPTTQAGLYPDGPDILYIVATPISGSAGSIQARISWKEAQA